MPTKPIAVRRMIFSVSTHEKFYKLVWLRWTVSEDSAHEFILFQPELTVGQIKDKIAQEPDGFSRNLQQIFDDINKNELSDEILIREGTNLHLRVHRERASTKSTPWPCTANLRLTTIVPYLAYPKDFTGNQYNNCIAIDHGKQINGPVGKKEVNCQYNGVEVADAGFQLNGPFMAEGQDGLDKWKVLLPGNLSQK